jgi:MFS family permease
MTAQALNVLLFQHGVPVGIMSVYAATTTVCGLLSGGLADKYDPKRLAPPFLLILVGTYSLYSFAYTTRDYLFVLVVSGIMYSLAANALLVTVRKSMPLEEKAQARAHGVLIASNFVGSGLAMWVGLTIVGNPSLLWSCVVGTGATAIALLLWGLALASSSTKMPLRQLIKRGLSLVSGTMMGMFERDALIVALPDVGVSSCYWAFLTWFVIYVGKDAGVILLVTTVVICIMVLTVMPKLVVKMGHRSVIGWSITILMASLLLIGIGGHGPFWLPLLAGMLVGVSMAGNNLSISVAVQRKVNPNRLGKGIATANFLKQLGGVIGPSYSGFMWSFLGGTNMWLSLSLLLGVSMAMLFFLKPKEIIFVRMNNQACCQWAMSALPLCRRDLETFSESLKKIPDMSPYPYLDFKPRANEQKTIRLMCESAHLIYAVRLLEEVQKFDGFSVEKELKALRKVLERLLTEQFSIHGEKEGILAQKYNDAFRVIISEQTHVAHVAHTVEDAKRFLYAAASLVLRDGPHEGVVKNLLKKNNLENWTLDGVQGSVLEYK